MEALVSDRPDYAHMGPAAARITRHVLAYLATDIRQLGAVRQLTFKGVSPAGGDMFAVQFDHTAVNVEILCDSDGMIEIVLPALRVSGRLSGRCRAIHDRECSPCRIAIMGFDLETNAWAPSVGRPQFEECIYLVGTGDRSRSRLRQSAMSPRNSRLRRSHVREAALGAGLYICRQLWRRGTDRAGASWTRFSMKRERAFAHAGPVDAVYIAGHGAAIGTENPNPMRHCTKPFAPAWERIPIVATVDLHALVSPRMVRPPTFSAPIARTRTSINMTAVPKPPTR